VVVAAVGIYVKSEPSRDAPAADVPEGRALAPLNKPESVTTRHRRDRVRVVRGPPAQHSGSLLPCASHSHAGRRYEPPPTLTAASRRRLQLGAVLVQFVELVPAGGVHARPTASGSRQCHQGTRPPGARSRQ
jgi:hypothetical protein